MIKKDLNTTLKQGEKLPMLQETKPNKTILAENTVALPGPLHGKSLRNPSPLFGFHVTCQVLCTSSWSAHVSLLS